MPFRWTPYVENIAKRNYDLSNEGNSFADPRMPGLWSSQPVQPVSHSPRKLLFRDFYFFTVIYFHFHATKISAGENIN